MLWKNLLVCAFGVMSLIFGTLTSIEDIIKEYSSDHLAYPDMLDITNQTIANLTSGLVDAIIVPEATTLSP